MKSFSRRDFLKVAVSAPVGAALAGGVYRVFGEEPAPSEGCCPCVIRSGKVVTKPDSEIIITENMFVGGNPYSDAIETGMTQAAEHYGVETRYGGPPTVDHAAQAAEIETWIAEGVDVITCLVGDAELLTPSINKAVEAGIWVITWDSDAPFSKRQLYWNQSTDEMQAIAQIEQLATGMNGEGEWAFIVGQLTQHFKMVQYEIMQKYAEENYPGMVHVGIQESNDEVGKAANIVKQLLVQYPDLKGIVSNSGGGLSGAAQGVRDSGMSEKIAVTGLAIPSMTRQYFHDGTIQKAFLWDVYKYGYGLVSISYMLLHGQDITPGTPIAIWDDEEVPANILPNASNPMNLDVVLGPPLALTKDNIDNYEF